MLAMSSPHSYVLQLFFHWQVKNEGRAIFVTIAQLQAQFAAMCLNDSFSDIEAKPAAALGTASGQARIGMEELAPLACGDADAHVVDADVSGMFCFPGAYSNRCFLVRIFDGVIQQIPHCLLQSSGIPVPNHRLFGSLYGKCMIWSDGAYLLHNIFDELYSIACMT